MQIQFECLQGQKNQVPTIVVILARLIKEQCLLDTAVKWTVAVCLKIKAKHDIVTRFKHLPNIHSVIKDTSNDGRKGLPTTWSIVTLYSHRFDFGKFRRRNNRALHIRQNFFPIYITILALSGFGHKTT